MGCPACPNCHSETDYHMVYCPRCGHHLASPIGIEKRGHIGYSVYAGFWWRFLAFLLDEVILGVTSSVVGLIYSAYFAQFVHIYPVFAAHFASIQGIKPSDMRTFVGWSEGMGFYFLARWLYFAAMESSPVQGTVGKLAVSIRVTDLYGARISFGRATGRYFAKFITNLTFFIGYIMAGFTKRKQALHDKIAGTLVVQG